MTAKTSAPPVPRADLVLALHEIVEALDRRGPQIERAGESRIARDALALRGEAVSRLEALQRADHGGRGDDLAQAVMTDDGGGAAAGPR